ARNPVEGFDRGTIRRRRRRDREIEVGSATRGDVAQQPPMRLRGHRAVRIQTLDSQPHVGDAPGKTTVEVSLHCKTPAGISPLFDRSRSETNRRILNERVVPALGIPGSYTARGTARWPHTLNQPRAAGMRMAAGKTRRASTPPGSSREGIEAKPWSGRAQRTPTPSAKNDSAVGSAIGMYSPAPSARARPSPSAPRLR